jgi:hypothetical protein
VGLDELEKERATEDQSDTGAALLVDEATSICDSLATWSDRSSSQPGAPGHSVEEIRERLKTLLRKYD